MKSLYQSVLLCVATLLPQTLFAGQVEHLYQADVAATSSASVWQQDAFRQVLAKVSGQENVHQQAKINEEMRRVAGYIKQFEAVRSAEGNRMRVLLDAAKVNQLLQQNNIAVWGALRPDILVWLVEQQGAQRQFVRQNTHSFYQALRQAFAQTALPLLQPLYDIDDLLSLSETDVWAGFWQPLEQASARYNADVVIAATLEHLQQDGGALYRLSWQRNDNGRIQRDEVSADNEAALMQAFAWKLAQQLAANYATVLSATPAQFVLQINGLTDLAAIVQVQKILQQLIGVSGVTISAYQNGSARYTLNSGVDAQGLISALRFNPQLRLQPQLSLPQLDVSALPVLATLEYTKH